MILPRQCQLPGLDPIFRIVVSRGTKFNVVCRLVVRKGLLYLFIKLLGKHCQIPGGVESGLSQLPWSWAEHSVYDLNASMHLGPSLSLSL